jgi:hypothetical protein
MRGGGASVHPRQGTIMLHHQIVPMSGTVLQLGAE